MDMLVKEHDGYARKRTKNIELWKDSVKKMKRNTGEAYTSYKSEKNVAARSIGPPCSCGGFTKIGINKTQILFDKFWKIGNFNDQNAYLSKLLKSEDPGRSRIT